MPPGVLGERLDLENPSDSNVECREIRCSGGG